MAGVCPSFVVSPARKGAGCEAYIPEPAPFRAGLRLSQKMNTP